MNKYILDEFYQNCLIEETEDGNLSSFESDSKIEETSKEDIESSNSISQLNSSIISKKNLGNLQFSSNLKKSENIILEKPFELKFFFENDEKMERRDINKNQSSEESLANKLTHKTTEIKAENFILNQNKRTNLMLSPLQNYVNLAYANSEIKEMKQLISSPLLDKNEDFEDFMEKLQENCKINLGRDDVLKMPFEIMKEYYKTTVKGFDKGKETILRSTFNSRNEILYYIKSIFCDKDDGDVNKY